MTHHKLDKHNEGRGRTSHLREPLTHRKGVMFR
jgi:hypothetical protein